MTRSELDPLPELFWSAARRLRRHAQHSLAPYELNPSHSRALGVLERHGAMRLSDLSEHLRIAPRSATEVVDALAERQLVQRQPDPHDRRATLVVLTEHGSEVSSLIHAARSEEAERFFGALSVSDRRHLTRILAILAATPE